MITTALLLASLAAATPDDPGLVHPDAAQTPTGQLALSVGLGAYGLVDFHSDRTDLSLDPAAELRASWAITGGLRIDAAGGGLAGGMGKYGELQPDPYLHLGARWA